MYSSQGGSQLFLCRFPHAPPLHGLSPPLPFPGRMELSLPRRPPGRPFGSKDSRPRKRHRERSRMDEQEEINEANADKKWLTYKDLISKRFKMRSGKVLPTPPPGRHAPPVFSAVFCFTR